MGDIRIHRLEIELEDGLDYEIGDAVKGKCIIDLSGTIRRSMVKITLNCDGEAKWEEESFFHSMTTAEPENFCERMKFLGILYKHPTHSKFDGLILILNLIIILE